MKKILIILSLTLLLNACKSTSPVSTKLDNKTEVALKGDWALTSVTYPGSEYIKVTSFNIEDSQCFVNSEWSFVSNNNKGQMQLTKPGCSGYSSPLTWYINKEGKFVMKLLEGVKAKKMEAGYILTVANISDSTFQLIDTVNVGGKNINVVYQFSRK
jgi:hypothetical protein